MSHLDAVAPVEEKSSQMQRVQAGGTAGHLHFAVAVAVAKDLDLNVHLGTC